MLTLCLMFHSFMCLLVPTGFSKVGSSLCSNQRHCTFRRAHRSWTKINLISCSFACDLTNSSQATAHINIQQEQRWRPEVQQCGGMEPNRRVPALVWLQVASPSHSLALSCHGTALPAAAVTGLLVAKCTAGISAEGWYLGSSM